MILTHLNSHSLLEVPGNGKRVQELFSDVVVVVAVVDSRSHNSRSSQVSSLDSGRKTIHNGKENVRRPDEGILAPHAQNRLDKVRIDLPRVGEREQTGRFLPKQQ